VRGECGRVPEERPCEFPPLETTNSSLRAFSLHTYYLLGPKPVSTRQMPPFPIVCTTLLFITSARPGFRYHGIARGNSIELQILSSFVLFRFSISVFEDLSVWQFFLRYLVSSWMSIVKWSVRPITVPQRISIQAHRPRSVLSSSKEETTMVDLSDPTISFVALWLGGKSTFDGVLTV
jgi:hypothetical protein